MKTLVPFLLALALAAPVEAQTIRQSAQPGLDIPDDAYVGLGDGNDGTGEDAGMACAALDFSGEPDTAVLSGYLRVGVTHTWVGDLTIKLRSPGGLVLPVLARPLGDGLGPDVAGDDGTGCCGDSSEIRSTHPLAFADGSPNEAETLGDGLTDMEVACSDDGRCVFTPGPSAAAGGTPSTIDSFAAFGGASSLGIWTVCVGDAVADDTGTFDEVELALSSSPVALADDPAGAFAFGVVGANPFRTSTALGLRVPTAQPVRATLHDMLGREVAVLFEGTAVAGAETRIAVSADALAAGTYIARVSGETFATTQSLTVAR